MDNPIRLLVTLEVRTSDDDYAATRDALREYAWSVVDDIRSHRLFPVVYTFPGWHDPNQMLDFGFLHEFWPINGPNVMCIRICRSPIDDAIADDFRSIGATPGEHTTVSMHDAIERSAILSCINSLLSKPGLVRGTAALVGDCEPSPTLVPSVDDGMRVLRRHLVEVSHEDDAAKFGSAIAVAALPEEGTNTKS